MIRFFHTWVYLIVLGCWLALATEGSSRGDSLLLEKEITYKGWKFVVTVPPTISVKHNKPADFETYSFLNSNDLRSDPLLIAYAGNHPKFPRDTPEGVTVQKITLGPLEAKSVEWADGKGRYYRETLVQLPKHFAVPQYVLFYYRMISAEEKEVADKIIESIKAVGEREKN